MRPFAARSLTPGHLPPALARPFALRGQDCAVSLFCPYCADGANCAASTDCANGTNYTTCAIVLPAPTGLGWQQLGLLSVCPTSGHCKFQAQKTFKPARCPEQQRASRRKTCRNKTAPSAADARRDAVVPCEPFTYNALTVGQSQSTFTILHSTRAAAHSQKLLPTAWKSRTWPEPPALRARARNR